MNPVSTRALVQRIKRKFVAEDLILRATRGGRARRDLGHYYVVDNRGGGVADFRVDLEELGRKEGVLKPSEFLVPLGSHA